MSLDRRSFLKTFISSSMAALFFPFNKLFAGKVAAKILDEQRFPYLVAIRDGSPTQMFDIGIKAIGGMERFVKKGQTVLVKPNIMYNRAIPQGIHTNKHLVGRIVKAAYEAGAKQVFVFDNIGRRHMKYCYKKSGIYKIVKDNKGIMSPSDDIKYYRKVEIRGGKTLKEAFVHKLYLDSDVVINVPILKHHVGTRMTASIKNLMGVVWDRKYYHREGLYQCIADFPNVRQPDLNIIDAYRIIVKNGPQGISPKDLYQTHFQLIGTDMVFADSAASKILKEPIEKIHYLKMAEAHGYGNGDLKKHTIKRISCKNNKAHIQNQNLAEKEFFNAS